MFKQCKYCGSFFKDIGNFCSDMCEIKSYEPFVMQFETKTTPSEIKEEVDQVKEEFPKTSTVINDFVEIKEKLTQVETDLGVSETKTEKIMTN